MVVNRGKQGRRVFLGDKKGPEARVIIERGGVKRGETPFKKGGLRALKSGEKRG